MSNVGQKHRRRKMFCEKCGSKLNDNQFFCSVCGEKVVRDTQEMNTVESRPFKLKHSNSSRKKHWIIGLILLFILIICLTGAFFAVKWYFSPEQEISRSLAVKDYEKAYHIYANAENINSEKLIDTLSAEINGVKAQFQEGTMDYETASKTLDTIKKMNLNEIRDDVDNSIAYIEKLNESMAAYITALSFEEQGNYEQALLFIRQVIVEDRDYEEAQVKLKEIAEQYRQSILEQVAKYEETQEYDKAIVVLQTAMNLLPADAKFKERISTLESMAINQKIEEVKTSAEQFYLEGDIPTAISILGNGILNYGGNADIINMLTDYDAEYYNWAVAEAERLTGEKNYQSAIDLLVDATRVLTNENERNELNDLIANIKYRMPVDIATLNPFSKNNSWKINYGECIDRFGNSYAAATNYMDVDSAIYGWANDEQSCEYRVYGEYTKISGHVAQDITPDSYGDYSVYFKIYSDDTLVYTSPQINEKTDAFDFDVSIKGADYLRLETTRKNCRGHIILSDVMLKKE